MIIKVIILIIIIIIIERVVLENIHIPPPPNPTEGNGYSEERGIRREVISEGVGGCSERIFFQWV